jgi:hypothetical protein
MFLGTASWYAFSLTSLTVFYSLAFQRTIDRVDTLEGRVEALATMSLMQMLADAYEDAQVIWERNKEQGGQEDDDVSQSIIYLVSITYAPIGSLNRTAPTKHRRSATFFCIFATC